jgi:hypothetical protein
MLVVPCLSYVVAVAAAVAAASAVGPASSCFRFFAMAVINNDCFLVGSSVRCVVDRQWNAKRLCLTAIEVRELIAVPRRNNKCVGDLVRAKMIRKRGA